MPNSCCCTAAAELRRIDSNGSLHHIHTAHRLTGHHKRAHVGLEIKGVEQVSQGALAQQHAAIQLLWGERRVAAGWMGRCHAQHAALSMAQKGHAAASIAVMLHHVMLRHAAMLRHEAALQKRSSRATAMPL